MPDAALPRSTAASPANPAGARKPKSRPGTVWTPSLDATSWTPPALTPQNHPLARRHYRVATSAIEEFVTLVDNCLRVLTPGALIHARPRMGKTHAVDYMVLHLSRARPSVLVLRMSCEYHRTDFEGAFFNSLLVATGQNNLKTTTISQKRFVLLQRIIEQLQRRAGHIVVLLCDEGQRLSKHALEWLRDVHDQLAHHGVRLLTFLVGQPQLLENKAMYQLSGDEQIVARFMIEQLHFRGITCAQDAATCMASYDQSRYPEETGPTFVEFYYPLAFGAGMRLERSGATAWNAFVNAHTSAQLAGPVEIPMDYFTRAVESVLTMGPKWDGIGLELTAVHWQRAVAESGYVAAQQTVRLGS